jgi:hypothetical protein
VAFDEALAQRVRMVVGLRVAAEEKEMFGGLAFMVAGHMCCGVVGSELMVRVGPDAYDSALRLEGAREMDFTGRPMKGMIFVGEGGLADDDRLAGWVDRGISFIETLPPKR